LGGVQNHAIAVIAGVFHDERSHDGEDLISDLALLGLEIFLRILRRAIKTLLLGLDFFYQLVAGGVVELVLLSSKLLLQAVDFVGLALRSFCLGSNFLASSAKSRCPWLERKIACSMLMVPTLVPVAFDAAAAAADGESGAVQRRAGRLGPERRGRGRIRRPR